MQRSPRTALRCRGHTGRELSLPERVGEVRKQLKTHVNIKGDYIRLYTTLFRLHAGRHETVQARRNTRKIRREPKNHTV
ncbi:Uncharacterised protein [Rikenella microfusus]|uniref:Uncharacterized protein n=1 Tax=Rikenella microfusus TaxID=28139 RepID=A0A379MV06_9BACT|nr:Uncharacterised protein [Rikenella microfusus]